MAYLWGQLIPMDGNTVECCENNNVKAQNGNELRLCSAIDEERVQEDEKKNQQTRWYSSLYSTPMFGEMRYEVNRKFGFCVQKDGTTTNLIETLSKKTICVHKEGLNNKFSGGIGCNYFIKQSECNANENVDVGFCGEVFDGSLDDEKSLITKYNKLLNKCYSKNQNNYNIKNQSDIDCVKAIICLKSILITNTNDWNNGISLSTSTSFDFKN